MKMTDVKIYMLNGAAIALNFTAIEIGLKMVLTAVVIGYTINKWWIMYRDNKKNE